MPLFKRERNIENVYSHTWYLAWEEHRVATMFVLGAVALSLVIFPVSLLIAAVYFGFFFVKAKKMFFQQFAKKHGLEYTDSASLETVSGKLFEIGHNQHISHVLSGKIGNMPFRTFSYQTSITLNSAENSKEKRLAYSVFELTTKETVFPYILLNSNSMPRHMMLRPEKTVTLPIEPEYAETYVLEATEGYEIEVFEILTPEILTMLQINAPELSIEFSGNRIYFYDDKPILARRDLETITAAIKKFVKLAGKKIESLSDDFEALDPYYAVK